MPRISTPMSAATVRWIHSIQTWDPASMPGRNWPSKQPGQCGTGEARIRGANEHADDDEHERGGDGRGGEPLEAGHWSSGHGRSRILALPAPISRSATTLSPWHPPSPSGRPGSPSRRSASPSWRRPAVGAGRRPRPGRSIAERERIRGLPGRAGSRPDPAGWGPPAQTPSVFPVLITSPVVCGPNRVLFSFIDADNRPIAAPDRSASLAIYELGRDAEAPIATVQGDVRLGASRTSRGSTSRTLSFPSSGRYGAEFVTAAAGGPSETIRMTFDVQPSSPVVKVGDHAPASKTPTLADVGGDVSRISTDDDPDPSFYETSVDQALADHEPFVLVFATPKFCKTAQCGPTLDRIKPFADAVPDRHVHQRRAVQADVRRRRRSRPTSTPNGDLQTVPAADEWHLLHEPVVYVVDRRASSRPRSS